LWRGEIRPVAGGRDYAGKPRRVVIVQDDSFDATDSITICAFTADETDAPLFRLQVQPTNRNCLRATCRLTAAFAHDRTYPSGMSEAEPTPLTAERLAELLRQLPEFANTTLQAAEQIRNHQLTLGQQVAAVGEQVNLLAAGRAELDETIQAALDNIAATVTGAVEPEIAKLVNTLTQIRTEIMARIDRLQGTVELVREDGRVNWATADTALNRAKNYREKIDSLTLTLSVMERRYQTLMAMVQELRDEKKLPPSWDDQLG
jgi:mRNA-degrading endonuclease toxin of MazEF toxin-antitoxin module